MSIDSATNKIWVLARDFGTTYGSFTLTINAVLPGSQVTASFTFELILNPCKNRPFYPPPFVDQLYYITEPEGSYEPGAFTTDPECPQDIVYSNSVSTNDWITGFTDNGGAGKLVRW